MQTAKSSGPFENSVFENRARENTRLIASFITGYLYITNERGSDKRVSHSDIKMITIIYILKTLKISKFYILLQWFQTTSSMRYVILKAYKKNGIYRFVLFVKRVQ